MVTYKNQYVLPLVILFLSFSPLLGIVHLFGVEFPVFILSNLMIIFAYMPIITALLGLFAVYRQIKLYQQTSTKNNTLHLILTSLLLLPALYPLFTVILLWSVAFMI